ncbi:saccharopine dehydrogenase family protein [Croceimicrobium hydrocarbonivorans]|uniref:Saccharopine dehydrogenase NADP-binding domain-containing protein n=1 Tax=Croceimicrobium hydrocarbonivorans TaxID=2761580 RepID=A0A7H0VCE9_9FLAO|nr:saccharopine dehydrogenase C-terminal domain-containing protein [Croceimicrobium hydrocarbonivorans]QNR23397.1 saccharopine dehydrogenase NADP-binding domain-containing protein [Croceimicrobium hydrocarbonivorans]
MRHILLIGAGRSTYSFVEYIKQHSEQEDWHLIIADQDYELAKEKAGDHPRMEAVSFDVKDEISRVSAISKADIVVSMLPAHMHIPVASDCIALGKHMLTASYISDEMKALDERAKEAGVILINEIGVDPGIDHLSAMKVLDQIRAKGGEMLLFESFTGGLVAPENDDNPWNYKFTWNPRNVVLAGSGGAVKFIQEGKYKYIPYHQLFRRTEIIAIDGYGKFEGYANRDSLKYRDVYGLKSIPTIYRGTFRRPGFCRAWDVFVKLGMTDDSYQLEVSPEMTFRDFTNLFLAYNPQDSVELKLMHYLNIPQDSELMDKLTWLGIFDDTPIGLDRPTPAQVLQRILETKWTLGKDEKDMIVMFHKFGYMLNGEKKMIESSMVALGKNSRETAMARTVGLPLAIATRHILNGNISTPGVQIPITKEIYMPMLDELADYGISFTEKEVPYRGY